MIVEAKIRQDQIDCQLARAGWSVASRQLIEEFAVRPGTVREPDRTYKSTAEFADYALLDRLGRPIAIVEAKRSSRDALAGERQAADYADAIRAEHGVDPFVFLANGDEIWFWHWKLYPQIQQRHWIVFGPSGEGAFAETYRGQVEALVKDLAGENPALQRLQRGEDLTPDDIEAIAAVLQGPDLFVTEERLREAFHQPKASLADFLRHILNVSVLPSREESISHAFDEWVRQHTHLSATQLMFVRTLRKAVMQKAEISSLDALRQPPFSTIGDPEQLFKKPELDELIDLAQSLAA